MEQIVMLYEISKLIREISFGLDAREKCMLVSIGLSPSQARVISEIDKHYFFTHTILSKQCNISKSTLSEALKVLEQRGLIERIRCKNDKRKSYINLTSKGQGVRNALLSDGTGGKGKKAVDMTQLEIKLLYILLKKLQHHIENIT